MSQGWNDQEDRPMTDEERDAEWNKFYRRLGEELLNTAYRAIYEAVCNSFPYEQYILEAIRDGVEKATRA